MEAKLGGIAITVMIWSLWKERNRRVFQNKQRKHEEVSKLAITDMRMVQRRSKIWGLTSQGRDEEHTGAGDLSYSSANIPSTSYLVHDRPP